MSNRGTPRLGRREFLQTGVAGGIALASLPAAWANSPAETGAETDPSSPEIRAMVREATLFAGIRKPITQRRELEPRIASLEKACEGRIVGPLTHIFRFDTPVEGFDSEIGFPVSAPIETGEIVTHELRRMHFYAALHQGPHDTLRETSRKLYAYMDRTGLSPELELQEVYRQRDAADPERCRTDVMASFLAWPEAYREQLLRVLGPDRTQDVWRGGERLTPHTLVDERCAWVAETIRRLKAVTDPEQQFDILSRVCLKRPIEDVMETKKVYDQTHDVQAVFQALQDKLKKTPTGGFVDPLRFDGTTLHVSKVPRDGERYAQARTLEEKRRAYCFCNLVREARDPKVDPIFCYRAAGWARQFWEPILGVEFSRCVITHSILKGDAFCAWDYQLTPSGPPPPA